MEKQIVKPVNYLWLVINVTVKNNDWGRTRSFVIVAENEEEVKTFIKDLDNKNDAVSGKARIDSFPAWPEESLQDEYWINDASINIDECKFIQVGLASPSVSKGFLIIDNIGA